MVLSPNMVTEAEVSVQYRLCVSKEPAIVHQIDVGSSPVLREARVPDSVPAEFARFESVRFDLLTFSPFFFFGSQLVLTLH